MLIGILTAIVCVIPIGLETCVLRIVVVVIVVVQLALGLPQSMS